MDLGPHIGAVARRLYGEPNQRLSTATELRFGTNGSLSIDVESGCWYDHEQKEGGNVVELIARSGVAKNGGIGGWLRDNLGLEDDYAPPQSARPPEKQSTRKEIEAVYDYVDEHGDLLYQAVRFKFLDSAGKPVLKDGKSRKTFSQRRPDGDGEWLWSIKGIRTVPYRLPELLEAVGGDQVVFIVEGEKKVDRLIELGCRATCNPMGAGKGADIFAALLAGAHVVILPDNDDAGRKHADMIGASLKGIAASVKLLDLPGLGPKDDIVDWLDRGGTVEELWALVDTAPTWGERPPSLRFGAVWFSEAEHKLASPTWLIHNIITSGDKSLVFGPSQSGKSFLATHLALSIARGVDCFDRKVRRGGVVYIAAEGKKGFKKRLAAYRKSFELDDNAVLPFLLVPTALDLFNRDGDIVSLLEDLRLVLPFMIAMGVGIDLVVIDTLAAVSPGANENASEDMSRIIQNCEKIQELTHGHVMIVHHKNAAGDRPRGHTSLYAAVDNAIEVFCDEAKDRTAKIAKLKDAEDGTSIGFRLQSVTIGSDDDGQPITSCVVVPAHAGMARTSERKLALTPQTKVALTALYSALGDFGEDAPGILQLPYGTRVVQYKRWMHRFAETSFEADDTKPEALKKAMARAGSQLLSRSIIGRNQNYVWIARGDMENGQ